jgi:mannosyl-3-phosphoglycerate phosphatase
MPGWTASWSARSSAFTSRLWPQSSRVEPQFATKRIVLFSDPDTLRQDSLPERSPTRLAIRALEARGVTLVLWGNETRSQMEVIQRDLDLHHPFISETGGGLFIPHGYFPDRQLLGRPSQNYRVVDFGKPYYQVAEALHEVARKSDVGIVAFSDMSIQDVALDCKLSLSQARLAKLREYDEPFRMLESEPAIHSRIYNALRRLGYRCFAHEAFHHATGVTSSTRSLRLLASLYREAFAGDMLTVGLAKACSETGLLRAVDIPIVVQSDATDVARLGRKVPTARFANAEGSQDWYEAVLDLIDGRSNGR